MKTCTKCNIEKPFREFFIRDKQTGRRHAQCKSCYKIHRTTYYKDHYTKYHDEYLKRAKQRRDNKKQEYRFKMLELLQKSSCILCGENDVRVLEFDHRDKDTKKFSISQATRLGRSWFEIEEEIKKCDLLCSNCHKKRTSKQFSWYKEL